MFRNIYRQVNDEIKGDRSILDRAFLQAAQPEKRQSPVLKYSFVGTAVAAVVVAGAIFMNSELFLDKGEKLAPVEVMPTQIQEDDAEPYNFVPEGRMTGAIEDQVMYFDNPDADESQQDVADTDEQAAEIANEQIDDGAVEQLENVQDNNNEAIATQERADIPLNDIAVDVTPNVVEEVVVDNTLQIMSLEEENAPVIASVEDDESNLSMKAYSAEDAIESDADAEADLKVSSSGGSGGGSSAFSLREVNETVAVEDVTEAIQPIAEAEAVEMAQAVCNILYNRVDTHYDNDANMWTVTFSVDESLDGSLTVFIDGNGVIQNIIYPN